MQNNFLKLFVLVALGICPVFAFASSGGGEDISAVVSQVLNASSNLVSGSPFAATGTRLFQLLLVILIAWKGIKITLDTGAANQVVAELVQIILVAGIASIFLMPATQQQLADGFTSLANTASTASGGGSGAVTNPTEAVTRTMGQFFDAAKKLWDGPEKLAQSGGGGWLDFDMGISKIKDMVLTLMTVFMRFFTAMFTIAAALIYLGNLFISQIMVNIGLALAPIFIPWILWDSTAFLFHGWLKFMIVTGVQKIVGALLFGMTVNMINTATNIASQAGGTAEVNFYVYCAVFIVVGLMAMMMVQVNTIANGLVSGSPHTSFSPPKAMTPGGMANRAGGRASVASGSGIAQRAGSTASGAIRGGASDAWSAAKNARAGGAGPVATAAAAIKSGAKGAATGGFQGFKKGKP